MGFFSVFLLLSLMTTVLNAHDAPQFAGAVNITHSDDVWFVKLTLESMFGIAVSPRYNSSLLRLCGAVARVPDPKTCTPVNPYDRIAPGAIWFSVESLSPFEGVSVVEFYVDTYQPLESGERSRTFDILPNGTEMFSFPPTPTLKLEFLPGGLGLLEAFATDLEVQPLSCYEVDGVCYLSSMEAAPPLPWLITLQVDNRDLRITDPNASAPMNFAVEKQIRASNIPTRELRFGERVAVFNLSVSEPVVFNVTASASGNVPAYGMWCRVVSPDGSHNESCVGSTAVTAFVTQGSGSLFKKWIAEPSFGNANASLPWFLLITRLPDVNVTDLYVVLEDFGPPTVLEWGATGVMPPAAETPLFVLPSANASYLGVFQLQGRDGSVIPKYYSWSFGATPADLTPASSFTDDDYYTDRCDPASRALYVSREATTYVDPNPPPPLRFALVPLPWHNVSVVPGTVVTVDVAAVSHVLLSLDNPGGHEVVVTLDGVAAQDMFVCSSLSTYNYLLGRVNAPLFLIKDEHAYAYLKFEPPSSAPLRFIFGTRQTVQFVPGCVNLTVPAGDSVLLLNAPALVGADDDMWYTLTWDLPPGVDIWQWKLFSGAVKAPNTIIDAWYTSSDSSAFIVHADNANTIALHTGVVNAFSSGGGGRITNLLFPSPMGGVVVASLSAAANHNLVAVDYDIEGANISSCVAELSNYVIPDIHRPSVTNSIPFTGQNVNLGTGNNTMRLIVWCDAACSINISMRPRYALVACSSDWACNGRGSCNSLVDPTLDSCECLGFQNAYCDVRNARQIFLLLIVGSLMLGYTLAYIVFLQIRSRLRRKRDWLVVDNNSTNLELSEPAATRLVEQRNIQGALITAENIHVEGRLQGITTDLRPGELTLVMGGSGAGKSSFLAALIGNLSLSSGQIYWNGVQSNLGGSLRSLIGFVPQHDILLEDMTTKENVRWSCDLRCRGSFAERKRRVRDTLHRLQLHHVRHQLVSKISGGQRRRVSMAMELVCEPPVLVADEVTSGLDSESAHMCMEILAKYAVSTGRTVVVVIHQPALSILELAHHLLVLRVGGRVGWDGPGLAGENAMRVFATSLPAAWRRDGGDGDEESLEAFILPGENVADWLLSKVIAMGPAEGGAPISAGLQRRELMLARRDEALVGGAHDQPDTRITNPIWQFFVFGGQSLIQLTRNWVKLLLSVALVIVAAVILGFVFRDDLYVGPVDTSVSEQCPLWLLERCRQPRVDPIPSWSSMVSLAIGLTALASSVSVFLGEFPMIERQRRSGINVLSYFLARNLFDGAPNVLVPPLMFALVFNYFMQLGMGISRFYLILVCAQFTCLGIGYACSLVAKSAPFLAGVVVVLVSIAFSGVQPTLKELNQTAIVGFLSNFSFSRWMVQSLYVSEVWPLRHIYNIQPGLNALSYSSDPNLPLAYLVALGIAFRLLALLTYTIPWLQRKLVNFKWRGNNNER